MRVAAVRVGAPARVALGARDAERAARLRLTGAIVYTALAEPGVSEVALAERFGVTRVTLRKALGR